MAAHDDWFFDKITDILPMQPQRLYARIALQLIQENRMRRASALKQQRDLAWESYQLSLRLDRIPKDSIKRVKKEFFLRSWTLMVQSLERSNPDLLRHEGNARPVKDQLKKNAKGQIVLNKNGHVTVTKNNHWITHSTEPFSDEVRGTNFAYQLNLIVTDLGMEQHPVLHPFQVGWKKATPISMDQAILEAAAHINDGVRTGSMRRAWGGNVRHITSYP